MPNILPVPSSFASHSIPTTNSWPETYSLPASMVPTLGDNGIAQESPPFDREEREDEPTLNLYNDSTIEHVGPSGDTGANYLHTNGFKDPDEHGQLSSKHGRGSLQRTVTQDDNTDPVFFKIVGSPSARTSSLPNGKSPTASYDAHVDITAVFRTLQRAGPALVDVYLRSAHRAFPIINQERVTNNLMRFINTNRDPSPSDSSLLVLYVSLMIVGHHWHFLLPSGSSLPELDITMLRNFCKQALPRELCMPRLVTIQSILLEHALLVSTHDGDSLIEVWTACGNLVTSAQNLGLHRNPERWNIAKWEIQIRKKLWWAIFVTEKWLAYSVGRPSLIHPDDWTVTPLLPSDFEPSFDLGAARFIAMADLTCIISDIHSTLFTPRNAARLAGDFAATRAIAIPLSLRIDAWYEKERNTLESIDVESYQEEVQSPCSLQLAHLAVRVAIHRALLRCGQKADKAVRTDAVKTMRDIADWAKRITSQDVLSVWWGCAGSQLLAISNFFLSLTISAPTEGEFMALKKMVQTWRWNLRINLQSFPRLAKSALQRVDELFKDGDKLDAIWQHNKYRTPGGGATRAGSPSTTGNGGEGNSMLDLARLASRLNGTSNNQLGLPMQTPTFSQALLTPQSNNAPAFSFDGIPSIDQIFDFQIPENSLDHLDMNFSLEQFMSWGSPNTGETNENLRALSEQKDWVL